MQVIVRYNFSKLIHMMRARGANMTYERRWQVSHLMGDQYHDAYFVCHPTRKQIRQCRRQAMKKWQATQ